MKLYLDRTPDPNSPPPPHRLSPTQNDPSAGVKIVYHPDGSNVTCANGKKRRTTLLLLCGVGRGMPVFDHETPATDPNACEFFFIWYTDMVCMNRTHSEETDCTVEDENGATIDLSPLISSAGNWLALDSRENDNYTYSINVCRPLSILPGSPLANSDCQRSGAGACQYKPNDPTFKPLALGQFAAPKYSDGRVSVSLTQLGTSCPQYNRTRTTTITFVCPASAEAGLGNPVFERELDCNYFFRWETRAACPITGEEGPGGGGGSGNAILCQATDALGNSFDLSPLKSLDFKQIEGVKEEYFAFGICGKSSQCDGAVCLRQGPTATPKAIAQAANGTLEVEGQVVTLSYLGANGAETEIVFQCDPDMPPTSPVAATAVKWVSGHQDASYHLFEVRTSLVCVQSTTSCVVSGNGHTYDLSLLSKITGNWMAPDEREDGALRGKRQEKGIEGV